MGTNAKLHDAAQNSGPVNLVLRRKAVGVGAGFFMFWALCWTYGGLIVVSKFVDVLKNGSFSTPWFTLVWLFFWAGSLYVVVRFIWLEVSVESICVVGSRLLLRRSVGALRHTRKFDLVEMSNIRPASGFRSDSAEIIFTYRTSEWRIGEGLSKRDADRVVETLKILRKRLGTTEMKAIRGENRVQH